VTSDEERPAKLYREESENEINSRTQTAKELAKKG
jgi:hypothetical protein